jgi:hypothetical protein
MTPKILCIKSLELEVEKIMSIQEFAFQLSKKIQDQHSVKISRSHIYELIALDQAIGLIALLLLKIFYLMLNMMILKNIISMN